MNRILLAWLIINLCSGLDPAWVETVIYRESRGDPTAYSQGNYGLMQVNTIHAWRLGPGEDLMDPEVNIRVGCQIMAECQAGTLQQTYNCYRGR